MDKTLQKCLTLKEDVSTFRQKASDAKHEYERTILILAEEYKFIANNLESFLEKDVLVKSLYENEVGRGETGQYLLRLKPWILLGDLMNEQMKMINSYAGCKIDVHDTHWENDSECGEARTEKGILIRTGLEKPVDWWPKGNTLPPTLTVKLKSGKEEKYGMTSILTCYPGMYERSHTSSIKIFDQNNNSHTFPNRTMFEAEQIAREALNIYESSKGR